jgi:hypothetical protein
MYICHTYICYGACSLFWNGIYISFPPFLLLLGSCVGRNTRKLLGGGHGQADRWIPTDGDHWLHAYTTRLPLHKSDQNITPRQQQTIRRMVFAFRIINQIHSPSSNTSWPLSHARVLFSSPSLKKYRWAPVSRLPEISSKYWSIFFEQNLVFIQNLSKFVKFE